MVCKVLVYLLCSNLLIISAFKQIYAQQAIIQGSITEADGIPVPFATVRITGTPTGATADSLGRFRLAIPSGLLITCSVSHIGYKEVQKNFMLNERQVFEWNIVLERDTKVLREVEIKSARGILLKPQISITSISPQTVKNLPSAFGDFNKILATLPGVVSNNELSATYSVRGGSFDENLVYVNGIEIYRPFLIRSGQQEGLSFVNPDLVGNVEFSSGGWQPRYGDKLSSVLDISYKEPDSLAGSVTLSLLGGSGHIEGKAYNKRISYVAGIREKRSQYLLGTLNVKGEYLPKFTDFQSYIHIDLSKRRSTENKGPTAAGSFYPQTSIGILLSYARNRYFIRPVSQQTSFGTLDQVFTLFVAFAGQELLNYDMYQNGVKFTHRPNSKFTFNLTASGMQTSEREYTETEGAYRLCDVGFNPATGKFNDCIATRGAGSLYTRFRNKLNASIINLENRNLFEASLRNKLEWGFRYGHEKINDILEENTFIDSASYVRRNETLLTDLFIETNRLSAYGQHTFVLNPQHTFTYGFRLGYWSLNKQFLFSPSFQYAFQPDWEKQVSFKLAAGIYRQPPFYREMRTRLGELNTRLKAQSSLHLIAGAERVVKLWGREFLFTSEAYYKQIWDVVAYDIENVRLRYYANNDTKAYAWGTDLRLSGEFIKGAESWFSMGVLSTKEDLSFDSNGYVRRPTDQRFTVSAFFQDHLPNNPTLRVYMNLIYGSGLPFSPPQVLRYRSAFTAPSYRRIDLGFSKIITFKNKIKGAGRFTESIWLGAEILNVVGARNTISYTWITDTQRRQYAVPNTLSARFLNIRVIAKF